MSSVEERKKRQGFVDLYVPRICGNCQNFEFAGGAVTNSRKNISQRLSGLLCRIGKFAVTRKGSCKLHEWDKRSLER